MALKKDKSYDVKLLFGSTDREAYEIYCRNILEILNDNEWFLKIAKENGLSVNNSVRSPFADKPLLLSIALEKIIEENTEIKLFKVIVEQIKQNLINIV